MLMKQRRSLFREHLKWWGKIFNRENESGEVAPWVKPFAWKHEGQSLDPQDPLTAKWVWGRQDSQSKAGRLNLLMGKPRVKLKNTAPVKEVEIHGGELHLSPGPPHMHT